MKSILFGLFMLLAIPLFASRILIPMDESQSNHLKAYGVTFWVLGNIGFLCLTMSCVWFLFCL